MANLPLYPPSPEDVPEDLTEFSSEYGTQSFMVLLSLVVFFLFYFGLMFFCAGFILWAIFLCPYERGWMLIKIVALALSIPFACQFLFMAKNFFRYERAGKSEYTEIFEDEHPKLFEFIEKVCTEVGAPMPRHVYVDYNVNAMAIVSFSSVLHLFLPTDLSLLIGLGLVNSLNLTEFKAVLAHEFGHFTQFSKLDNFAFMARSLVGRVVDGDDFFDRFIHGWSQLDVRISWPAWIVKGMLWIMRKIVWSIWYAIFYIGRAHDRGSEFHADLVAVSLCGSDAPVHANRHFVIGSVCFQQAVDDLKVALDNHLYSADLFYHQSAALKVVRKRKDKKLDEPPPLPDDPTVMTQVFEDDGDEATQLWDNHPSDFDRENNVKAHYIRSHFDDRSPWLLFENVEELRERITYKLYRHYFRIPKNVILADPEEVQGFIDDEHATRTYDPKYQGLYDNRNLILKDMTELAQDGSKQPWSITELGHAHATLYNAEVKHRSQLYYKRSEEINMLNAILNGWYLPKDDEIEFRGEIYGLEDAKRLFKKVDKELVKDNKWLEEQDRRVFMCYFQMALHINQAVAEELYKRYDFHLELQNIWFELQKQNPPVQAAIAFLNSEESQQMNEKGFLELLDIFRQAHKTMKGMLRTADDMMLPALKNLPAGQPLKPFLLEKRLVDGLSKYEHRISVNWINKLLNQFNEMKAKVDRIHFKSLAGVLSLQERIGDECVRRWSSLPAVRPV